MTETEMQNMLMADYSKSSAKIVSNNGSFQVERTEKTSIKQQSAGQLHEEQMRVTSIQFESARLVIFSGVPITKNSYRVNSGKYFVTIKVNPDELPVPPSRGQHWSICGERTVQNVNSNGFEMGQHLYESPDRLECTLPQDGELLIEFLSRNKEFKGIGESKARALWNVLGTSFQSVMKRDTPDARRRLQGVLSDDSIDALYDGFKKYKNLRYANWMIKRGIPSSIQHRLFKHHDNSSIDAIQANPYLLCSFGMSFSAVDALIEKGHFKVAKNDDHRLSASLEFALRKEVNKGHTYTTQRDIRPILRRLLGDDELVAQAFIAGYDKAQYLLNPVTGTYHPVAQLLMEVTVAKRLLACASKTDLYDNDASEAYRAAASELPYKLTEKQEEAVTTSLDNAVACITGGAGTGKTTVLRTALRAYDAMGYKIHAIALSGRAAMRLNESIGFKTMTIARFLRIPPIECLNDDDSKHLVVIDEASMVDLPTMYRIITHINPMVRIVLSGDPNQLPPIGCGKVLSDIVESKQIANTMLDIVKRQESSTGIPEYSQMINNGLVPTNLTTGAIHFHEAHKNDIADLCCQLYQQAPEQSRVVAPTKAMVKDINEQVQIAVNPEGRQLHFQLGVEDFFIKLREGDAVLFTQNLYDKGIQNGSLGILTSVEQTDESFGEATLDTGEKVQLTQAVLDCMQLGYAITLHKAQGSQFPRVIIGLARGRIVDRSWLYTAITRAESEIHIVGSADELGSITREPSNASRRNSHLLNILSDVPATA